MPTKQTVSVEYLSCSIETDNKRTSLKCSYDPSDFVVSLGNPAAQSWALIVVPLLGFVCYGILLFLSHRLKYVCFTRNFVLFQVGPLSAILFLRFVLGCIFKFQPSGHVYFPDFLVVAYDYLRRSADFNLYCGAAVFQYLSLKVARQRRPLTTQYSWTPFVAAVGFSYAISLFSLISMVQTAYTAALWIVRTFYSLFCLVTLFALCCCSSPIIGQSVEPYVSNARSRMLWTIPFHIPYMYALTMREYATMLAWYIDLVVPALRSSLGSNTQITIDMTGMKYVAFASDLIEPLLILLAVIAFLPAYRSVVLSTQGYTNPRVGQLQLVHMPVQVQMPVQMQMQTPPAEYKPPVN